MKLLLVILSLCLFTALHAQDTTFRVRGYTCTCLYTVNEETVLFDKDAIEASYPGGEEEWKKFLRKNLDKGFKGSHTVDLRFQVDRNGDLSNFVLTSRAPNQKFEEVVRVLKLSGKWFPSIQKGFCVKSQKRISVSL